MASPLTILQVISSPWWTGAALSVLDLSRGLTARGHRVFLALIPGGGLEDRARLAEVPLVTNLRLNRRGNPLWFFSDWIRLRKLLKGHDIDVVHTHLSHDHWAAALAQQRMQDRPISLRTFHSQRAVKGDPISRRLYVHMTDGAVAVSDPIRQACLGRAGFQSELVRTIPGAVDPDWFLPCPPKSELAKRLGLNGTGSLIGIVSRLAPDRGHVALLEAFAHVRKEIPGTKLLIVGKGEHAPEVRLKLRMLGLIGDVIMTDYWEEDIRDALALMDIFVLLSPGSGGAGRALLEAMAMELPSVVADCGGLSEIVVEGESGVVVPLGEVSALAKAIIELLRDPERAKRMGTAARQRVKENYPLDLLVERTEEWYLELIERR